MNGEVLIVDEFTGRILHGRRYNEGMHQAIEAKEGVEIKDENQTLATITLQNYFRLYDKLAGMTGTAHDRGRRVRPDLQARRRPDPDQPADDPRTTSRTSSTRPRTAKFDAVVEDIAERHEKGQPVLVGTTSVEKSELLSASCCAAASRTRCSTPSTTSGRRQIVAQAGRKGAVTVATNMAGRGTDIMLGGNPEFMADAELRQRGPVAGRRRPRSTRRPGRTRWRRRRRRSQAEHEEVVERRRALRPRHRAARVPPHRQPAARPLRPAGRPGRVALLPLARRRPHAAVQRRRGRGDHEPAQHARRRADRVEDGDPRDPVARRPRSSSRTSRSARTS